MGAALGFALAVSLASRVLLAAPQDEGGVQEPSEEAPPTAEEDLPASAVPS